MWVFWGVKEGGKANRLTGQQADRLKDWKAKRQTGGRKRQQEQQGTTNGVPRKARNEDILPRTFSSA